MLTPEEFVVRWKSGKLIEMRPDLYQSLWWESNDLVHYDPNVVQHLEIPESSKRFLIEAGMPRWTRKYSRFDFPPNHFPALPEVLPKLHISETYYRYRMIGKAQFQGSSGVIVTVAFFCLDEKANGQVVRLKFSEGLPAQFVNSSIQQYAEFLLLFRQEAEWHRSEHDKIQSLSDQIGVWGPFQERVHAYRDQMREQLKQIDSPATDSGSFWEKSIEELQWGE